MTPAEKLAAKMAREFDAAYERPVDEAPLPELPYAEALIQAREALAGMLASAVPHPTEHPTMTAAWSVGQSALSRLDALLGKAQESQ